MESYRCVLLGSAHQTIHVESFDAATAPEAIDRARAYVAAVGHTTGYELWCGIVQLVPCAALRAASVG
jgi:hypothetical protein